MFATMKKTALCGALCAAAIACQSAFAVDAADSESVRARAMRDVRNEQDRIERSVDRMNQQTRVGLDRVNQDARSAADRVGRETRAVVDRAEDGARDAARNVRATTDRAANNFEREMRDATQNTRVGENSQRFANWENSNASAMTAGSVNVPTADPIDRAWAVERAKLPNSMSEEGREDLLNLERRRTNQQASYFEKRRDYEEKLSEATPNSNQARRIQEDMRELEREYQQEMLEFQQDLRELEAQY